MVKVNFEDKQLNDGNESIECTMCNDCYILCSKMDKKKPDYEYVYICKACKEKFDRQCGFGFDPQGIIEAINVRLVKQGAFE